MKNKLWFKAKEYGWGWYPSTWQGWIVILIWVLIFAIILVNINESNPVFNFLLIAISVIILIYICYKKGEKPSWRWGNSKK